MSSTQPSSNALISHLADGVTFHPNDCFVAVMGITGAGKSSFISRCTGGGAIIEHGLVSCTQEVESFSFQFDNTTVHLIDTPGFDDTFRTDSDVLRDIASWLNVSYQANVRLSGIVYLHPIDKNRVTGSACKNFRIFQKLCGNSSLASVVLATTMWENVTQRDGVMREDQLKQKPEFWGEMLSQGSRVFRHMNNRDSALSIVKYILSQRTTTVLEIQKQMVDERKNLDETSAGQEVNKDLQRQREILESRLRQAEQEMEEAIAQGNQRGEERAAALQARFQSKLDAKVRESEELKVTMETLLQQRDMEYQEAVQNLHSVQERRLQESTEATRSILALRKEIKERDEEAEEDRRRYKKEAEDLSDRYFKQTMEVQWAAQRRIHDEELTAAIYASKGSSSSNGGAAVGTAAAQTVGYIAVAAIAAASCTVM